MAKRKRTKKRMRINLYLFLEDEDIIITEYRLLRFIFITLNKGITAQLIFLALALYDS